MDVYGTVKIFGQVLWRRGGGSVCVWCKMSVFVLTVFVSGCAQI